MKINAPFNFSCDCIERLYKKYLRYENLFQKEKKAHDATRNERTD